MNVFLSTLLLMLPLISGFAIRNKFIRGLEVFATAAYLIDVGGMFLTGYKVGTTSDNVELRAPRVALHYAKTWLCYDIFTSIPWRGVAPRFLGPQWESPELFDALPLVSLGRILTLARRTSLLNMDLMQWKHATRSIVKFAIFVWVSYQAWSFKIQ
jgi:hypothetical protein